MQTPSSQSAPDHLASGIVVTTVRQVGETEVDIPRQVLREELLYAIQKAPAGSVLLDIYPVDDEGTRVCLVFTQKLQKREGS